VGHSHATLYSSIKKILLMWVATRHHAGTGAQVPICVYTYIHEYMYMHTFMLMCMSMFVRMCMLIFSMCIHKDIHAHMHTYLHTLTAWDLFMREKERESASETERDSVCVCVHVCAWNCLRRIQAVWVCQYTHLESTTWRYISCITYKLTFENKSELCGWLIRRRALGFGV